MTEEQRNTLTNRLNTWAEKLRTFINDEAFFNHACAPYINEACETGDQRSALNLSYAITSLNNRPGLYDAQTRDWHNEEAKALWFEGHQIRDGFLVALAPGGA